MMEKKKILKRFKIVLVLSAVLVLPSLTFAKPTIKSVSPKSITRGKQKVMTIKANNFKSGNWNVVIFAPKGQNISKSTEETLWISNPYTTTNVVTGTLWTNGCARPGKYDMHFANSSYDFETMKTTTTSIAKKRNALLIKKGKNEAKIGKVSPKKLAKGSKANIKFKGKMLKYVSWGHFSKHKKGKSIWGVDIESGSIVTGTNSVSMNVTVVTNTASGFRDVELFGSNPKTDKEVCALKKNAIKIGKSKLKIKNVSPSQISNTGSANITISGKNLKNAMQVRLINSSNSFSYLEASKIKTNSKKKIIATFPITTTTSTGNYNLEVRGISGRGFVSNAVAITDTIQ